MTKLSILVPAYNEEKTLSTVIESLKKLKLEGVNKEIIIIDDGSKDRTSEILKVKKKNNPKLKIITHNRNKGKGAAIQTGLKKSDGGT